MTARKKSDEFLEGGLPAWLKNVQPGMTLRLRGYATRGTLPGSSPAPLTRVLGTATAAGDWITSGSLDYLNDRGLCNGNTDAAALFLTNMVKNSMMFLDINGPANDAQSFTRGQIEVDSDDDGLTDYEEWPDHTKNWLTNPYDRDTDDDGLLDGEEVLKKGLLAWTPKGSDPTKVDTDGDGLSDGLEVGLTLPMLADRQTTMSKTFNWWGSEGWGTNKIITATTPTLAGGIHKATGLRLTDADPSSVTDPANHDTDGDHYWDGPDVWVDAGNAGQILKMGEDYNGDGKCDLKGVDGEADTLDDETDPNNPSSHPEVNSNLAIDSDKDGLPDALEEEKGTNPNDADTDDDGVKDGDEVFSYHTNPTDPDSDHDGLPDGLELGLTYSANGTGRNSYNDKWFDHIGKNTIYCFQLPNLSLSYYQVTFLPLNNQSYRSDPCWFDSDFDGATDLEEFNHSPKSDPMRGLVRCADETTTTPINSRVEAPTYIAGAPPMNGYHQIVLNLRKDENGLWHWQTMLAVSLGLSPEQPITLSTSPPTPVFERSGQFLSSITISQEECKQYQGRFGIAQILMRCPRSEPNSLQITVNRGPGDSQIYAVGVSKFYKHSEYYEEYLEQNQ